MNWMLSLPLIPREKFMVLRYGVYHTHNTPVKINPDLSQLSVKNTPILTLFPPYTSVAGSVTSVSDHTPVNVPVTSVTELPISSNTCTTLQRRYLRLRH